VAKKTASDIKPIYVIAGKDDYLVGNRCQELLDSLIEPAQRAMGLLDADPDKIAAPEIFDELRTLPFLTSRRVVLLRGADDFISDNRELLERYFESPSTCGSLVLTVKSWPKNTRLAKKLDDVGELLGIEEIKPWELAQFVVDEAARRGKTISKQNAEFLRELVGDDAGRLASEVEKLALFADTQKVISASHIETLIGHNRLFDVWAVIDAIAVSDAAGAVEKLRNMFAGDRDTEYTVVGAFAWHFRRLFQAKASIEKGANPFHAALKLGIKPKTPRYDNFNRQLTRFSLQQLGSLLQELAQTDYHIKTGQASAAVAMEQFVVRLASKPAH
jgi:DNA polymerase-3 subunit delta